MTELTAPNAPTAEDLAALVKDTVEELADVASATATFDEMEVDSLSMAEIATILSQKYGVPLDETEVVEAGDFVALSSLLQARLRA